MTKNKNKAHIHETLQHKTGKTKKKKNKIMSIKIRIKKVT